MYTGEFIFARWMEDFVVKYIFKLWELKGDDKKKMEDEEERKKFNERCRINTKRLRDKKNNGELKPKGRPRKSHIVLINEIPLEAIN